MSPQPSEGQGRLTVLDADAVQRLLDPLAAVAAIEDALRAGLDPAGTPARSSVRAGEGELLLMPASTADVAGVKVVSVVPGNAARGLPRVQGLHVLFDALTLSPQAVVDGAALTTLRTPAVSVAAVRPALERRGLPLRAVVFGAGPQGVGHLRSVAALLLSQLATGEPSRERSGSPPAGAAPSTPPVLEATVVVRDVERAARPHVAGVRAQLVGAGDPAVTRALSGADLVVCATTSRAPLFAADAVRDDAVIVAVGAHELDAHEVEPALAARAQVVVEDRATAVRESGTVHAAVAAGWIRLEDVVPIRDVVVEGAAPTADRPLLFVSVGMAWEDLAIAQRLHRAYLEQASRV